MSPRRYRDGEPTMAMLGFAQYCTLQSLADDDKSARGISYDYPMVSEAAARSAINSLGRWGFVDAVRFEDRARIYGLTERGRAFVQANLIGDEDDE